MSVCGVCGRPAAGQGRTLSCRKEECFEPRRSCWRRSGFIVLKIVPKDAIRRCVACCAFVNTCLIDPLLSRFGVVSEDLATITKLCAQICLFCLRKTNSRTPCCCVRRMQQLQVEERTRSLRSFSCGTRSAATAEKSEVPQEQKRAHTWEVF